MMVHRLRVALMMVHRLRRWPKIKQALIQRPALAALIENQMTVDFSKIESTVPTVLGSFIYS